MPWGLGLEVFVGELWREDSDFFGVCFLECLWVDRRWLSFLFRFDESSARRNSGRHRSPQSLVLGLFGLLAASSNLDRSSKECTPMDLTELWMVAPGVRVDVECFQLIVVNCRSCVSVTIGEECGLSEVGSHAAVRQESRS